MGLELFVISWILLLIAPFFLAIWTSVQYIFLVKIPKNYYVFLICFLLFCDIFTYSRLMEMVRVNFAFDSYVLLCLCESSCVIFSPSFYRMILVLGLWFYDDYLCFLIDSFNLGKFNLLLFWCIILNLVKLESCGISHFC